MMNNSSFITDWFSPPGDTINTLLSRKKIAINDFSKDINFSEEDTKKLLAGDISINENLANSLSNILGASKEFWMNREREFQLDKERILSSKSEKESFINRFPVQDIKKYGWADISGKTDDKYLKLLKFFDTSNISEWEKKYSNTMASVQFKISHSFESNAESIISWLEQGKNAASRTEISDYDQQKFKVTLSETRELSRDKDPESFLPKLIESFAVVGVHIVIFPTPKKCAVVGATYQVGGNPVIQLSGRHLSDDHFWFSLYHEAGHALLHQHQDLFIDGDTLHADYEEEANQFAFDCLIPKEFQKEFFSLKTSDWKGIVRFARKIKVSPGIVLGQMQKHNLAKHNQLSKLKNRFKWDDGRLVQKT